MARQTFDPLTEEHPLPVVPLALALSLGAAVSLGISRFAYGLLLPPMRMDLGWSYALAGLMNTSNALGYLIGALATPALMRRLGPSRLMLWGSWMACGLMAASGFFDQAPVWLAQRLLAGVASAMVFICGGLLAARLGALQPGRGGLLIGIYYGGSGIGITVSALLVPAASHWAPGSGSVPTWAWAWWVLALACVASTVCMHWPARVMAALPATASGGAGGDTRAVIRPLGFALAGYGMFGIGYIGYMTFVVALLRESGLSPSRITLFYALLGMAVVASSRLWAGLLDRRRDGGALALLNGLLGIATVMPAISTAWPMALLSGLMFGGVFLSVVASTTALVRHSLPQAGWAAGIGAFTVVFAAGQIVGPTMVGWIADGPGGLARGLVCSAVALWIGALLAWRQRAADAGH